MEEENEKAGNVKMAFIRVNLIFKSLYAKACSEVIPESEVMG